jgi:lipopolysaccharide transport system ATP-binding protein
MIAVRAAAVGKAYRVYRSPLDSLKELFLKKDYSETFWALQDVSLDVGKGDAVGVIGDNGAGKTTLLKILAGAMAPTVGTIERTGRVSAMLNLGAGFHPDLSGRENIHIGCAVLGLSPSDTEQLLPRIVAFSELGTFIERPFRTYSSGMQLRLGFSVATAVDPEILVVDEHLSVGDQHFRFKCIRRIMDLRAAGCTLVFCSHDPHAVEQVCDRVLWLRDGRPAMLARAPDVLKAYQDHVRARDADAASAADAPAERRRPEENYLQDIELVGGDQIESGERLELKIVVSLTQAAWQEGAHLAVVIVRNDAIWCYGAMTGDGIGGLFPLGADTYGARFIVEPLPLLSGQYSFTVALMDDRSPHTYDFRTGAAAFTVRHVTKEVGVSRIPYRWERP